MPYQPKLENIETICQPTLFRLFKENEKEHFNYTLNRNPYIQVYDCIKNQLRELIKINNPSTSLNESQLNEALTHHLGGIPPEIYGVWVYYPWSNRMVHVLDEEEFKQLRTSRNQYKITPEEQALLATKKVGVIGLSVGQSVSVAMAMERSFGEIRIADFDTIDFSNLNRIRTGIHNIGIKKTIVTAREIAEIDPYLKVVCFNEGISQDNLDDFMQSGGILDALIEECDGIEIKIKSRLKARDLRIPVIMDTSDRGMLDIERFDTEPERPLFHGLLDSVNFLENEKYSPEQKSEIVNLILNKNEISERFRFSISEIGKTLTTWPQLASAVIAGGANAADIYRRIMLGQSHVSGRFYIDNELLVN